MGAIFVLIAVVLAFWFSFLVKKPSSGTALRRVAQRLNGSYQPKRPFSPAHARVPYGSTSVDLTVIKRPTGTVGGQASLWWPEPQTAVHVQTHSFQESFDSDEPWDLFSTSSPDFNRLYLIRTRNPAHADRLLSDGVQWQLEKLRLAIGRPELYVTWAQHRLIVKKMMPVRRVSDWETFTRLVFELYDQSMLTLSTGIEFLADGEARPIEDPICQICGESITIDMVFCARCMTPHHRDCWQYYGTCSTYGCDERGFVTPTVARPVDSPSEEAP